MLALRLPGWPRAPTRSGTRHLVTVAEAEAFSLAPTRSGTRHSAFPESPPLDVGRPCRRAPRRRRARTSPGLGTRRATPSPTASAGAPGGGALESACLV